MPTVGHDSSDIASNEIVSCVRGAAGSGNGRIAAGSGRASLMQESPAVTEEKLKLILAFGGNSTIGLSATQSHLRNPRALEPNGKFVTSASINSPASKSNGKTRNVSPLPKSKIGSARRKTSRLG